LHLNNTEPQEKLVTEVAEEAVLLANEIALHRQCLALPHRTH
jgi:hypothetical protein